jgi:hypothetical protein
MPEFVLLFRMDILTKEAQPSAEQMKLYMEDWDRWVGGIAALDKITGGHHLSTDGRVVRAGNAVDDGPYAVNRESVAGYITVSADNFDEAVQLANECPILQGEGNSVEIRKME